VRFIFVATLVAAAFIGPRPDGLEVCHKDDDKDDNRPGNLYYGTRDQNIADSIKNDRWLHGERVPCAKLTEQAVREIWRLKDTMDDAALGRLYGVTAGAIYRVRRGDNWRHVTESLE
jgi:hypothetical protein